MHRSERLVGVEKQLGEKIENEVIKQKKMQWLLRSLESFINKHKFVFFLIIILFQRNEELLYQCMKDFVSIVSNYSKKIAIWKVCTKFFDEIKI